MLLKPIKNRYYIQSDVFRQNQSHEEKACDKYLCLQKEQSYFYDFLSQPATSITVKSAHDLKNSARSIHDRKTAKSKP